MSAPSGYHIVSDPLEGDWERYTTLEFFRSISHGEPIPEWVTVTGIEEFLLYLDDDDTTTSISFLNRLLTDTKPGKPLAVQFLVKGTVTEDEHVYIKPATSPDTRIYIDALFRDPPTREGPEHFYSERA